MNSRERILTAIRGYQPDRVPVIALGINPYVLRNGRFTCSPKYIDLSYKRLCEFIQNYSDVYYLMDIPRFDEHCIEKYTETLSIDRGEYFEVHREVPTPEGKLNSVFRRSKTGPRIWISEQPFIKNREDLKKILSGVRFVPYSNELVESFTEEFFKAQKTLAEDGIVVINTTNAMFEVLHLFSYDFGYSLAYAEKETFHSLLKSAHEVIYENLRRFLKKGINDCIFRMGGSEHSTPPFLPPSLFKEYVVHYDRSLINLIQEHEAIVELHCHGKIRQVLEDIISMHPDALDPLEPPPQGDIILGEVKKKTGYKVCLIGNIPATGLLHDYSEEEVEKHVRKAIEVGAPGGSFILSPTSFLPVAKFSTVQENNIIQFVRSGLKYGKYSMGCQESSSP